MNVSIRAGSVPSEQVGHSRLPAVMARLDTINALPKGTSIDASRYVIGDGTSYCEDDPADQNAPVMVVDIRDMTLPQAPIPQP